MKKRLSTIPSKVSGDDIVFKSSEDEDDESRLAFIDKFHDSEKSSAHTRGDRTSITSEYSEMSMRGSNRLSTVSKFYDVEGKGYLTSDQQMLRNLDTDGDGKLNAKEIIPFLARHNELRSDNKKLKRNQMMLGATTILFGIVTIVATIIAIRASKDTIINSEGLLAEKGTGRAVVTQSKGVSIVSELHGDDFDVANGGEKNECVRVEDLALLYKSFGEGTDMQILTNTSRVTGSKDASTATFPITKVRGASAAINETHVTIGDVLFDIAADNPCNRGGRKYPRGPRKLLDDHLSGMELQTPFSAAEELQVIYDAVIIGAGWSGISAAKRLLKDGHKKILLLEARDYVGGRSRTVTDFATEEPDTPFELGSEFIYTGYENVIYDVFQDEYLAYETIDYFSYGLFTYTDNTKETTAEDEDGERVSSTIEAMRMDDSLAEELSSKIWSDGFVDYLSKLDWFKDSDYQSLLEKYANEEELTELEVQVLWAEANANIQIEYAEDPGEVSARGTKDWLTEVTSAGMALVSVPGGGYARALKGVVDDNGVSDNIRFGAEVTDVRYGKDLVEIGYIQDGDTSQSHSVQAQTVLVTVPLGVLKSNDIKFDPPLPQEKIEAMNTMDVGVLDKFILYWDEETMEKAPVFKEKWDEVKDRTWFQLVTPEIDTSTDWTVFLNSRAYNGLHSMTAWIGGSAADAMEVMEDEDILDQVLANLKMMFGSDVLPPTKFMVTRWGTDKYSKGSYSYRSVDIDFEGVAETISRSVDDKVFFAGEHTSDSGWAGTAVGAYETGEAAAKAMSKEISGEVLVSVHYGASNAIMFS
jgi:protoporphyrinogen oxidase